MIWTNTSSTCRERWRINTTANTNSVLSVPTQLKILQKKSRVASRRLILGLNQVRLAMKVIILNLLKLHLEIMKANQLKVLQMSKRMMNKRILLLISNLRMIINKTSKRKNQVILSKRSKMIPNKLRALSKKDLLDHQMWLARNLKKKILLQLNQILRTRRVWHIWMIYRLLLAVR